MPARIALLLLLSHAAFAADWSQWRGPARTGISAERGWLAAWPEGSEPKVLWRAQAGKGHSAVSVQGNLAYTMGWDGTNDTIFCLDAVSGAVKWKQSYPSATIVQWSGPRATPTVADGAVYTLGQHGQLRAWDALTGAPRWSVDLPKTYEPDVDYGFTWSPLVEAGLVILGTGSKGLALRASDGAYAWGHDGKPGACVSPMPFTANGTRAVAVMAMDPSRDHVSVVGVELKTGRELWRFGPWKEKWGAACSDLVIHEGRAFISTAEQHKLCAQFQFHPRPVTERWNNRKLSTYTGNVVLLDGHLYGIDKTGILKCLAWDTGEERWSQRGFDEFGTLIASDGKLIVQAGKSGTLSIVEATPTAFRELRKMKVFTDEPATFTAPVLAHGRLYCRSYAGEMVCLDLTPKP
jgi:outer membrane protein assembly factor BamB